MPDEFVPLGKWLRVDAPVSEIAVQEPAQCPEEPIESLDDFDSRPAIADARRFRASVADAVAASASRILHEIAFAVLARELQSAPVDIEAVVRRTIGDHLEETATVRVHPEHAGLQISGLAVVADPNLRPGDAVLTVREGTIDATLGARLKAVLDAC